MPAADRPFQAILDQVIGGVGRAGQGPGIAPLGTMPVKSVLAKDSFIVGQDGRIAVGPLFVMEKRPAGFSQVASDWHYAMVMPDGVIRQNAALQKFCNTCHRRAGAGNDHLMFLPLPYRLAKGAR